MSGRLAKSDKDYRPIDREWLTVVTSVGITRRRLPILISDMTARDHREYHELWRLADKHNTTVQFEHQRVLIR